MKKTILMCAFAVATLTMTSCKSEPKTETTTETSMDAETTSDAEAVTYTCPMGCEDGKTYTEPGKCTVCEMDLVASNESEAHDHSHDEHDGHTH